MPREVILATGNAGKLREFQGLLAPLGWTLIRQTAGVTDRSACQAVRTGSGSLPALALASTPSIDHSTGPQSAPSGLGRPVQPSGSQASTPTRGAVRRSARMITKSRLPRRRAQAHRNPMSRGSRTTRTVASRNGSAASAIRSSTAELPSQRIVVRRPRSGNPSWSHRNTSLPSRMFRCVPSANQPMKTTTTTMTRAPASAPRSGMDGRVGSGNAAGQSGRAPSPLAALLDSASQVAARC